jgi:hypothetical protein
VAHDSLYPVVKTIIHSLYISAVNKTKNNRASVLDGREQGHPTEKKKEAMQTMAQRKQQHVAVKRTEWGGVDGEKQEKKKPPRYISCITGI